MPQTLPTRFVQNSPQIKLPTILQPHSSLSDKREDDSINGYDDKVELCSSPGEEEDVVGSQSKEGFEFVFGLGESEFA